MAFLCFRRKETQFLLLSLLSVVYSQEEGDVRLLINGVVSTGPEGRVEVYSNAGPGPARWQRVCGEKWSLNEANIVCRQLGFPGAMEITDFGEGTQRHIIHLTGCTNDVIRLNLGCRFREARGRKDECKVGSGQNRDAGVRCSPLPGEPQDMLNPSSAMTPITISVKPTSRPTTRPNTPSASPSTQQTMKISTTTAMTSSTSSEITSDITTDVPFNTNSSIATGIVAPRTRGWLALYVVVPFCLLLIIIFIVIFLCRRYKKKTANTPPSRHAEQQATESHEFIRIGPSQIIVQQLSEEDYRYSPVAAVTTTSAKVGSNDDYQYSAVGPIKKENEVSGRVPEQESADEYQYSAVGPVVAKDEVSARVPKQDSVNEYQYSAVGPLKENDEVLVRVPKQDSNDDYQYSAVGPLQENDEVSARVPKQDSFDEYQYSAVGPLQENNEVSARVPKQDSFDEYQYSAVGPLQDNVEVSARVPRQDSADNYQYTAVSPSVDVTLRPTDKALSGVLTDDGFYIIPDRSIANPYQELNVKSTTFSDLQKLKKKPAAQNTSHQQTPSLQTSSPQTSSPPSKRAKPAAQNTSHQQTPSLQTSSPLTSSPPNKRAKQRPPNKPPRASLRGKALSANVSEKVYDLPVVAPPKPMELNNVTYGLGLENVKHSSQTQGVDEQCCETESTYANATQLQTLPGNGDGVGEYTDPENLYVNSQIGPLLTASDDDKNVYQGIGSQATLPV